LLFFSQVSWEGPDDAENPQNWSSRKKWSAAWIVAGFSTIGPLSSTILSSSIQQISVDLHEPDQSAGEQIAFSIYVLAWGIGPLFLGPLSEIYGRRAVLQAGNVAFVALTGASGASRSLAEFVVLRFLSGLAGSAALAVSHLRMRHIVLSTLGMLT
jgi:MFS family permease